MEESRNGENTPPQTLLQTPHRSLLILTPPQHILLRDWEVFMKNRKCFWNWFGLILLEVKSSSHLFANRNAEQLEISDRTVKTFDANCCRGRKTSILCFPWQWPVTRSSTSPGKVPLFFLAQFYHFLLEKKWNYHLRPILTRSTCPPRACPAVASPSFLLKKTAFLIFVSSPRSSSALKLKLEMMMVNGWKWSLTEK